jgi:hypothetical protein
MDFEDYYLHTLLPAESFFQTVLMNTDFSDIIVNDDKRAVIEKTFFSKDLHAEHFIESLKSGNHLFIRKMNRHTHQNLIDYIEDSYLLPLTEVNEIERELKNITVRIINNFYFKTYKQKH